MWQKEKYDLITCILEALFQDVNTTIISINMKKNDHFQLILHLPLAHSFGWLTEPQNSLSLLLSSRFAAL